MKKIIEYIKSHKEVTVIGLLVILFILNTILNPSQNTTNTPSSPPPSATELEKSTYKSTTIGEGNLEQLNKDLGTPTEQKEEEGKIYLKYNSSNKYRSHEAIIENNKVAYLKEIVNSNDNKKSDVIRTKYGQAPYTLYNKGNVDSSINLYVYPQKGIAYLGHEDGTVLEIWYFNPEMSIDAFQNRWAKDYSTNKSIRVIQ